MKNYTFLKRMLSLLLLFAVAVSAVGCTTDSSAAPSGDTEPAEGSAAPADGQETAANTDPINVVWYPNESSNSHEEVRNEIGRLIEQATGRPVEHHLTTDYTIAIEAITSGAADVAMAMGAVGYIEAKDRNPDIDVLFVNADQNGSDEEAKYFAWLCVDVDNAQDYLDGDAYSIDNIKGKNMSFVSNSSTSGFRVPTASIIEHFAEDDLDEDDLLPDGGFFNEVYFGGSHQGSAVNLVSGNVDVAAFCDIEVQIYIELVSGEENTVGAVYAVREDADAPFDQYAGKEFTVIACTPVFNGPCVYNPQNLSGDEIQAMRDLFTSEEVASNGILFYDDSVEGATGFYKVS